MWTPAYHPESCPPESSVKMKFPWSKGKPDIKLTWLDGNIRPERPEELGASEQMGNSDGGAVIEETKGKMMSGCYGENPTLLPTSKTKETMNVPKTVERVIGGQEGHYAQWVNACIAGYGKGKTSSNFDYAGPLTETVLFANLALLSWNLKDAQGKSFPGRKKLLWDAANMKITNFDEANQFVRRQYRDGYTFKA